MLNVHDLERRWLKYKVKRLLPFVLISSLIIISFISSLIYYPFKSTTDSTEEIAVVISKPLENVTVQKKPSDSIANVKKSTLEIEVPQNTQYTKENKTLVLKPSLHFMDNIEEGIDPYLSDISEEPLYNEVKESSTNNRTEINTKISVNDRRTSDTKKKLTIVVQKNENDLKDVIRRFKKNKNPALSLFIAKRYYELKQYQKSYNYALMTNEINKEIDDSWIIFSKSLVKLGQHELAVVTLKSYLKTNKSSQAEILLRKIEAGTFR